MFSLSNLTAGIVLVALLAGGTAAGKAALSPASQTAQEEPAEATLPTPEISPTTSPTSLPTPTAVATPSAEPTPPVVDDIVEEEARVEEEEVISAAKDHPDYHGAAVSTAAHCPIKGRAHGELVSSIAKNKDATVAEAEAACSAALGN